MRRHRRHTAWNIISDKSKQIEKARNAQFQFLQELLNSQANSQRNEVFIDLPSFMAKNV